MPTSAYHRLKTLLEQAGLPNILFHALRHPNVKPKTQNFLKQKSQIINRFDGVGVLPLYFTIVYKIQLIYELPLQFYYFGANILCTCAVNLLCKLCTGNGSFTYFKHIIANKTLNEQNQKLHKIALNCRIAVDKGQKSPQRATRKK